ncbi:MaoC/PaaZ C-terminal domain-containing protein [Rhodoferax sp.]|uniref:MaoC family dehydratase n=1 Tax=Rhodoferax sp. TaxID=50421 RepID=UPI0025D56A27|nr:MaoC/PaaZ C-terminal domain-containing protein [Rhodoferax sp.]
MTQPAATPISLDFQHRPRNGWALARSLLAGRPAQAPDGALTITFSASWQGAQAPAAKLQAYRQRCGLPANHTLPPLFLHAMAMPLHMAVMSHARFPLRLLGLVHLSNHMQCLRPIGDGEVLDMDCRMDGLLATDRGQEFTLHTRLLAGGETVWTERSTFLAPSPHRGPKPAPAAQPDWGPPLAQWAVAGNAGRQFASPSGDWNPIHISALSARLFGYPRAIGHGMFSAARCVALLQRDRPACEAIEIDVRFKRPLLIPGEVALHSRQEADCTRFVLKVLPHGEPHIEGALRSL